LSCRGQEPVLPGSRVRDNSLRLLLAQSLAAFAAWSRHAYRNSLRPFYREPLALRSEQKCLSIGRYPAAELGVIFFTSLGTNTAA